MSTPTKTEQIRPATLLSSETMYSNLEEFPLPETGIEHHNVLNVSLDRALGIIKLLGEHRSLDEYVADAAYAAEGILKQAKSVADDLFEKNTNTDQGRGEPGQIRPTTIHSNPAHDIAYQLMRITCDDIGQQTKALDFLLASFPTFADKLGEGEGDLFEGLYYVLSNINDEIKEKVAKADTIYTQGREVGLC